MERFVKFILTLLIGLIVFGSLYSVVYNLIPSNWFAHASFMTIGLLIIGLLCLVYFGFRATIWIWKNSLFLLMVSVVLQSCNYAKSNQQVVISKDCGESWEQVRSGDAVPTGTGNHCFMKVVMPNFPMQGNSKFVANLEGKVKIDTEIDYDYQIVDALPFIKQAKYLGSANKSADDKEALDPKEFEAAENTVIETRIRDVAKQLFVKEDIVEMDPTDLEKNLLDECNKVLKNLGVQLNFITLTFVPDDQTRQAIDVATAMKIYESKGLSELGKKIIEARAGATKIVVQQKDGSDKSSE